MDAYQYVYIQICFQMYLYTIKFVYLYRLLLNSSGFQWCLRNQGRPLSLILIPTDHRRLDLSWPGGRYVIVQSSRPEWLRGPPYPSILEAFQDQQRLIVDDCSCGNCHPMPKDTPKHDSHISLDSKPRVPQKCQQWTVNIPKASKACYSWGNESSWDFYPKKNWQFLPSLNSVALPWQPGLRLNHPVFLWPLQSCWRYTQARPVHQRLCRGCLKKMEHRMIFGSSPTHENDTNSWGCRKTRSTDCMITTHLCNKSTAANSARHERLRMKWSKATPPHTIPFLLWPSPKRVEPFGFSSCFIYDVW